MQNLYLPDLCFTSCITDTVNHQEYLSISASKHDH
jgi:hypothetical protein